MVIPKSLYTNIWRDFWPDYYWLTIFSSFLVILGTIISFVEKDLADTD